MPEKWTGDLVGKMHNNRIGYKELAGKLGVTKAYVSMVLNGSRKPAGARKKFEAALDAVVSEKMRQDVSQRGG